MARYTNVTVTLHHDDDVEVTFDTRVWHGTPGSWYKRNGDPGDPPEPAEVEILTATVRFANRPGSVAPAFTFEGMDDLLDRARNAALAAAADYN